MGSPEFDYYDCYGKGFHSLTLTYLLTYSPTHTYSLTHSQAIAKG